MLLITITIFKTVMILYHQMGQTELLNQVTAYTKKEVYCVLECHIV